VVPSSWLNIVLLSINLRKIVHFTQNYFDVQIGPSGKDVLEGKSPFLDNFVLNRFGQFDMSLKTSKPITVSFLLENLLEKQKTKNISIGTPF
jgi:hypothetical protein